MLTIFNRIFTPSVNSWTNSSKNGIIIPIAKQEKDKFNPEGYRPNNSIVRHV